MANSLYTKNCHNMFQASFNRTCAFVADKFGTYSGAIARILRGMSARGYRFIVSETFGLDCITLRWLTSMEKDLHSNFIS